MTADIRILSNDSIVALRRDHERLRYELLQTRTQLRAFMSQVSGLGLKPICSFTLTAALSTADASKGATITQQFGRGRAHKDTTITVKNLQRSGGSYVFSGVSGAAGYAFWDPATSQWCIFQMECPA